MAGRTDVTIAHRLPTIRAAGRVAVVKQRQAVELGTQLRLPARGGACARPRRPQFGGAAPGGTAG
jgi:ATP-binding cassette, subfamily B, bacterial